MTQPPAQSSGLTPEERESLQTALDAINLEMKNISEKYGDTVVIHPFCKYDEINQTAQFQIEIHTGRELFQ